MPAAARTLGEPDRRPKTRDASAFWHLIMFTRSFAIIDVEGRLVDWDAGFALEFSSVATSIARGLEWAVLIAAARDREGFTRGRPRDESENQNAAYDYRAHDQLIHIVEARLAGGGWCRIAHDVTRERDGDALGRQQEKKTQQFQKDKAVGRLTSGIAHDFNNLLMVALSNAESIIADTVPGSPTVKYAAAIKRAVDRGTTLTRQLLAFTRHQPLMPRSIDVERLFDEFSGLVGDSLGENIRFEVVAAADLWPLTADPPTLETALLNLVVNARDALPEGGVIKLRADNESVPLGHGEQLAAGDYVVLSVEHTGNGMAEDAPDQTSDPYFTTNDPGEGPGRGLSLVYGFARQSGGELRIDGSNGHGNKARLYERRYTILLVDDHDLVRTAVTANLESLNYRVLTADRGPAALELLESSEPIDLLFTDVVMPGGLSGAEVARRARELRPAIKVLFTSGFTSSALVQNGRLEAGVELLMKPYDLSELVATLKRILGS
jgi:signal transduction histidine kinase